MDHHVQIPPAESVDLSKGSASSCDLLSLADPAKLILPNVPMLEPADRSSGKAPFQTGESGVEKGQAQLSPADLLATEELKVKISVSSGHEQQGYKQAIQSLLERRFPGISDELRQRYLDKSGGAPVSENQVAVHLRQRLIESSVQIQDRAQRNEFVKHLGDFENRSTDIGLTAKEKILVYAQVLRLLEQPGQVERHLMVKAARELIRNAAFPTSIDQGQHNTCNVTALECRLYARTPSLAAKIVADVALTGKYISATGDLVKLLPGSLDPDEESRADPVAKGDRNYASQLFQLCAVNLHWVTQDTLPDGRFVGRGKIVYGQESRDGKIVEAVYDTSRNPPEPFTLKRADAAQPMLTIIHVAKINQRITGKSEQDLGITRGDGGHGIVAANSVDELKAALSRMKDNKSFPVLLSVDSALRPFGSRDASHNQLALHLVTLTDYDRRFQLASVDNQWGDHNDYTGQADQKARIPVGDLYEAMRTTRPLTGLFPDIWDRMGRYSLNDAGRASLAGSSAWLVGASSVGRLPGVCRSGLQSLGTPCAMRLVQATESGMGKLALRGGLTVGAVGVLAYVNDVPGAFDKGPEYGFSKLGRVAMTGLGFEVGRSITSDLLTRVGMKSARGRFGLVLAMGTAAAVVYDSAFGDYFEVQFQTLYRRIRSGKDYVPGEVPI